MVNWNPNYFIYFVSGESKEYLALHGKEYGGN